MTPVILDVSSVHRIQNNCSLSLSRSLFPVVFIHFGFFIVACVCHRLMTVGVKNKGETPLMVSSLSTSSDDGPQQQQQQQQQNSQPREGSRFFDFCSLSLEQKRMLSAGTAEDRFRSTVSLAAVKPEDVLRVQSLTWFEEFVCILFLASGVPNGVFTIPFLTVLVGYYGLGNITRAFQILLCLLLPLAVLPQPFLPHTLQSWLAHIITKYFSFRFIYEVPPVVQESDDVRKEDSRHDRSQGNCNNRQGPVSSTNTTTAATTTTHNIIRNRPQILVAPPHGVFPYGNILAMLVFPSVAGHHFWGLASNAPLRVPIFRQILQSIGVLDASRETARRALTTYPRTIGISTGGVAEVYETNADHECIVLRERVGLIKLAIRTGADLVPCYLFGNTKLLSCWIPGGRLFERWSRKIGFALLWPYGRFGLPIPHRIPVLGVTGPPIPTYHIQCEEPTPEQVRVVHEQLLVAMQELFDRYKGLYNWNDTELIIR